jgi:hypothetical protein
LTSREVEVMREARRDREADELLETTRREAPIKKAEAELLATHRELAKIERQRVTGVVEDDFVAARLQGRVFRDPDIASLNAIDYGRYSGLEQDQEFVQDHNAANLQTYLRLNPDVHFGPELTNLVGEFFDRNGIVLTTSDQIGKVVNRIRDAGLLPAPPPPPPPLKLAPKRPAVVKPKAPELIDGWDVVTGEPKKWTERALDMLPGDDYRRALRLYRADLALPDRNW